MKATGIIRRIDDLGRVVIPKEIRKTMHIMEGDPLEIFLSDENTVCFKKYNVDTSAELLAMAQNLRDNFQPEIAEIIEKAAIKVKIKEREEED